MTVQRYTADFFRHGVNETFDNHILYEMCNDYPKHDCPKIIRGKLLLIGRAYSAAPTRGAGTIKKGETNLFTAIAEAFHTYGIMDARIEAVKGLGQISETTLKEAVKLHYDVNKLVVTTINEWRKKFNVTSGDDAQNRISFISKYLHFHAPDSFFIYDSIIKKALIEKAGSKRGVYDIPFDTGIIEGYKSDYFKLCKKLLGYAKKHHPDGWSPRKIDSELYEY